jgi:uncharacterized OB-fold protein
MTATAEPTADHVPEFAPYLDDPLYSPFWAAAARDTVALPACPTCGVFQWYPLPGRPCGHVGPLEWRDLAGTGTIFTFTRIERAFLPSGSQPPYTSVLVELDGAPGTRLVSVLVGEGSATPAIGDRVRLSPTRFATHTLPTFALATPADN